MQRPIGFVVRAFATGLIILALIPVGSRADSGDRASDERSTGAAGQSAKQYRAGYTANPPTGGLRHAEVVYTLPELTCRPALENFGIGLGSEPRRGKPRYIAHTWLRCDEGVASYHLRAYLNGTAVEVPGFVGDKVRASVDRAESGVVTVLIENLTTGQSATRSGLPDDPDISAVDFGAFPVFIGHRILRVPDFGKVRLRNATIQGDDDPVCLSDASPTKNTRLDEETGEVEIDASKTTCVFALRFRSH